MLHLIISYTSFLFQRYIFPVTSLWANREAKSPQTTEPAAKYQHGQLCKNHTAESPGLNGSGLFYFYSNCF
jgi:hypothetical protein